MLPLCGRIFLQGGSQGARLGVLAEEVKDFRWGVGGDGMLREGGQQIHLRPGGGGEALLEVLLALLLDFDQLEEELLRVGAHLGGGA